MTDNLIFKNPGQGPSPVWSCSSVDDAGKLVALLRHDRWPALLRLIEWRSGRDRFREPRWDRQVDGRHTFVWPCTLCGTPVTVPAHHTERSCLALLESRFAVAKFASYGPF